MSKIKFGIAALKAAEENYQILLERLLKGYKKFTGKEAEGLDRIKIQQEAKKRAEDSAKVVDMEGRNLDPSKNIMGGTQDFEVEESFSLSNKPARAGFGKPPTPINKKVADLKEKELMESKTPFTDRVQAEIGDVTLYGDETFDELEIIRTTGKHPRIEKSEFALGGRVNLQLGGIPLTEKGQNIYDSMTRAGFDEMAIAQALDEQQVAPEITTPGLQQEAVAPPRIQPILPINQGGDTQPTPPSSPSYGYAPSKDLSIQDIGEGTITEEEEKFYQKEQLKSGLKGLGSLLGFVSNPLFFLAKKGYNMYQDNVQKGINETNRLEKEKLQRQLAEQEAIKEAARLQQIRDYGNYGESGGSYSGRGDEGATTANFSGDFATDSLSYDLKDGGLATMFVRKR